MTTKIFLNAAKQQKIIAGHPWVFPHAIQQIKGKPNTGEWVDVYDNEMNKIGGGFFNSNSLYRVRMIANKSLIEQFSNWQDIIQYRLEKALLLRTTLGLPNQANTAFRLCNSECDGLSGLVIDVLNDFAVVSSSAYWVEQNREQITHIIKTLLPKHQVLWFGQPKPLAQDGWTTPYRDTAQNLKTTIQEDSVLFEVHFENTQKTGIYIDQRENHARLARLCKGKKVLDLYTYHGGFAIHAAKAGAIEIKAVDSSEPAIEHAKRNAILNQTPDINWEVGDAKDFLNEAGHYDVVILDPPKLIPSKKHLNQAKNLYRFLHRQLFKVMQSGSILMTCNCSSALSMQDFTNLVAQQASNEGRQIQILGTFGPALCHPTLPIFPEGQYLSAILLSVM
jgi:23S rRNA (cytosine1962-C5)-methyltransferase